MKISSDSLIKDAQKLRKTQEDVKSKKSWSSTKNSKPAEKIQVTLDQLNANLKLHQQNIAKIQLENVALEQIDDNLSFLINNNPVDSKNFKRISKEIETALNSTKFRQTDLIPDTIKEAMNINLKDINNIKTAKSTVALRRNEITGELSMEYSQINKIQVSFENIMSLNMPSNNKIKPMIDDIREKLVLQQQIKKNVDPKTVANLLQ